MLGLEDTLVDTDVLVELDTEVLGLEDTEVLRDELGELDTDKLELGELDLEEDGEVEAARGPTQFPFWSKICLSCPVSFTTQKPSPVEIHSNFLAIGFYLLIN